MAAITVFSPLPLTFRLAFVFIPMRTPPTDMLVSTVVSTCAPDRIRLLSSASRYSFTGFSPAGASLAVKPERETISSAQSSSAVHLFILSVLPFRLGKGALLLL